jgi:hypothetical protein
MPWQHHPHQLQFHHLPKLLDLLLVSLNLLRLLHMMNVRFSLLNMAQRILGVTLPNF